MASNLSCLTILLLASFLNIELTTSSVLTFQYHANDTYVDERKQTEISVNISLPYGSQMAEVYLYNPESDDESYGVISGEHVIIHKDDENLGPNQTLQHYFNVSGKRLSVTPVYARGTIDGVGFAELRTGHLIKVLVWAPPYKTLVDYFLIAWIAITYVSMGVKIDTRLVWNRLKRPWPVFIGFLCQFVLMPLTSFALAKIFKLDTYTAIGLVTDGAAPGGWASNILALLLGLDFVLSITMTTCSTLIAVGTMPFNLWLYGTPFLDDELGVIVLPFRILIMQLGLLLVPVLSGMAIGHFWPKVGKYIEKALKPLAISLIVLALALGIPVKYYAFLASWEIYIAGLLLPIIGGVLGLIISLLCRLSLKKALTVGLETGFQNALLATSMLALAFQPPEKDLMARVPLLISVLSVGMCLVIIIIKKIYEFATGKSLVIKDDDDVIDDGDTMEMQDGKINGGFDGATTTSTQTEDPETGKPHALEHY